MRTVYALFLLCVAEAFVRLVPFRFWRGRLGKLSGQCRSAEGSRPNALEHGRKIAALVSHAADRLGYEIKCLPRAIAASWLLRRRQVTHSVVFAARPPHMHRSEDALHAWVEIDGVKIIGDLPGPWLETLRLGDPGARPSDWVATQGQIEH